MAQATQCDRRRLGCPRTVAGGMRSEGCAPVSAGRGYLRKRQGAGARAWRGWWWQRPGGSPRLAVERPEAGRRCKAPHLRGAVRRTPEKEEPHSPAPQDEQRSGLMEASPHQLEP